MKRERTGFLAGLALLLTGMFVLAACGGGDGDKDVSGKDAKTGDGGGDVQVLPDGEGGDAESLPDGEGGDAPTAEAKEELPPVEEVKPEVVPVEFPVDCEKLPDEFVPCGGDVLGTWKWLLVCFDESLLGDNPFAETCPEATMDADMEWDASVTFSPDGTFATEFESQKVTLHMVVPKTCLGPNGDCSVFGEDLACTDTGTACDCEKVQEDLDTGGETGTYVIEGTSLVMTDSEGNIDTNPYCIYGDKVAVEITEDDPETGPHTFYFVLEKVPQP